ncbi:MAG: hypothetical protein RE472_02970 [Thermoplasmatales archaeon]|nr:MAG: hypothetical protein RE472_02970 [Thermoplasmatales archaeon]
MSNSHKKVGRPVNADKDFSVRVSTTTTPELKKKINQSGYSVSYILQYGARVLLGDEREKELLEIERELATLKPKVAMLESRRDLILAEKKRIEALSLQKENEEIYIHAAFSQILRFQEKIEKITLKDHWIRQTYGISFDVDLVNSNFSEALSDLAFPPSYVIEKYRIKKVGKGEKEEKMMVELIESKKEVTQ